MRVRVLRGIFYGHRPDRDPEFDAEADNLVVARGLKHGLLELVEEPATAEPEPEPELASAEPELASAEPEPVKPATRRRKGK